ncbi:MAG TPA: SMI1/KNR4 family protein [Kamptonema sp.]|nr:SMI1/KNR4 family protein [Kamptonema sp.]
MSSIEMLRQLLTQLRTADTRLSLDLPSKHRYQLNPCLKEDEVQAFECQNNVILPDDYRQFLLELGNGGVGPGFGMLKLLSKNHYYCLDKPFPYEFPEDMILANGELNFNGTFPLAEYGCGMVALLVITGKQRGKLWFATGEDGIFPLGKNLCGFLHAGLDAYMEAEEPVCFSEWYRDWLVNSLAELEVNV